MRILLTGSHGKIGGYLANRWREQFRVSPLTRQDCDLSDAKALARALQARDFDLLVNCAALSTPEGCSENPAVAHAVNATAPEVMGQICQKKGAQLIHLSTDYVLDGSTIGLKDENARTGSDQPYGASKLAGETAVLDALPSAIVARVAWVFGTQGEGFLEKIYRLICSGESLEAVADKYSMPTSARDLAFALELLISKKASGVFHLTQGAPEPVSWHRYAQEVALAMYELGLTPELTPVTARTLADIPALSSSRPVHTAMTPRRLRLEFGHEMRDWREALRERVRELATQTSSN